MSFRKWIMLGDKCALCMHSLLAPPLAGKVEKLAEGARDDAQVSSRCASSLSRQVMNTDFPIGIASPFQLVEQLGIDHRTPRFEGMLMQKIGAQEFKGAVDIARVYAQDIPGEEVPAPGIEFAHPRVLAV